MTDNINPEYQHTHDTPPVEESGKRGNGLALLALIIGGLGTGIGIYSNMQLAKMQKNSALGQENPVIAQLEVAVQKQGQAQENFATLAQLDTLAKRLDSQQRQSGGVDKAQLEKMINEAITAAQVTPEKIADIAAKSSLQPEQVKTLINQALVNFAQGEHKVDLSKEIAAVQKSEAGAQAALDKVQAQVRRIDSGADAAIAKIQAEAGHINASLEHKIQTLQEALSAKSSAANPYPLLNALKMAQFAATDNNYIAAKNYLDQAAESFDLFGLDSEAYKSLRKAVTDLRTQYGILAGEPSPALRLDRVMSTVGQWSFKNVNPINLLANKKPAEPKDWTDRIKGIGQNILENTVTVTPIDDAGLAWVNANEALQNLLRENVRLDLAFARNALQLHNFKNYASVAQRLKTEITRYFDVKNEYVAAALTTLEQVKTQAEQAPDIRALIQQIEHAQNH